MSHTTTIVSQHASDLLFARMVATEELGSLFSYQVEWLSQDAALDLRAMLGKPMAVKLSESGCTRHFHGILCEASQTGFRTIDKLVYSTYKGTVVPKPWLLTQMVDCRIYVDSSVPQIIRSIFGEIGYADFKLSLSADYPEREYCVQYRESYFDFISRLMEQEGIYYYFTHKEHAHTMVLSDALGAHSATEGYEKIRYAGSAQSGNRNDAVISEWLSAYAVNSFKVQLTDYDPLKPKVSLVVSETAAEVDHNHGTSKLEVFDYPGQHPDVSTGTRYARVRAEAMNVASKQFTGKTDAVGLATGTLFKLTEFPSEKQNVEYLVTRTQITLVESGYASGGGAAAEFSCSFNAIESKQPYRSLTRATKPVVEGLQTAIVTGSDTDEEIVVDKYGRVQVTFHWNKPDKSKARSSCPVRVASAWAGKSWGAVSLPRVGQEVVVSFLDGDPDRPLIIGSVYNAANMPPYGLPDNKTQSGIKSRSHNGEAADANELRFEDKKGSEELYLHAQKDMREEVENDHFVAIEHDETVTIKNDQKVTIDHDQTESIKNDRKLTVGNNDTLDVTSNGTTKVGQKFKLSAGTEIELVTGASSIIMKSSGEIEIKGVNIKITGNATVAVKANATMELTAGASLKAHSDAMAELSGGAMTTVKGAVLMLKGDGMAQLSGGIIMIG